MRPGSECARRQFIKNFVVGTAFSVFMGRGRLGTLVADCQPIQSGAGILKVAVNDFPALQNEGGSVRLALNPFSPTNSNVTPFYPVLVNRGPGTQFFTLRTRCGHQGCVVPPFNVSQGASVCPCHGSRYDIDGSVLAGPTTLPLTPYTNSFDGTILCIEIPGLGYSVTGTTVESTVGPRFKLQFPTKSNVKYEVRFRQSLTDAGTAVPFSTTETGPATTNVLTGNGADATAYVDRTATEGFFSVAVQVTAG